MLKNNNAKYCNKMFLFYIRIISFLEHHLNCHIISTIVCLYSANVWHSYLYCVLQIVYYTCFFASKCFLAKPLNTHWFDIKYILFRSYNFKKILILFYNVILILLTKVRCQIFRNIIAAIFSLFLKSFVFSNYLLS